MNIDWDLLENFRSNLSKDIKAWDSKIYNFKEQVQGIKESYKDTIEVLELIKNNPQDSTFNGIPKKEVIKLIKNSVDSLKDFINKELPEIENILSILSK